MNINNNNSNPTDNFARPGKVLQQVFHTNGSVFLDQSHDHHDSNDKDLENLFHHGNRTRTSEEAPEDRSKDNNLFDFFFLNQDSEDLSPPANFKDNCNEDTSEDSFNSTDNPTKNTETQPIIEKNYVIPPNLRKPFKIPYGIKTAATPVITSLTKHNPSKVAQGSQPAITHHNTTLSPSSATHGHKKDPPNTPEPQIIKLPATAAPTTLNTNNTLTDLNPPNTHNVDNMTNNLVPLANPSDTSKSTDRNEPTAASDLTGNDNNTLPQKIFEGNSNSTPINRFFTPFKVTDALPRKTTLGNNPAPKIQEVFKISYNAEPTSTAANHSSSIHSILKKRLPTITDNINPNLKPPSTIRIEQEVKLASPNDPPLPPDLESLKHFITSQPKVLAPYIIELGNISLTHSKQIERKRDSFTLLTNNKKIPRSLRIKCELATSPLYTKDPIYISLRDELRNTVSEFIHKGTRIMTEWSKHNIELLTLERCSAFFYKALQIFDGMIAYNKEILTPPQWTYQSTQNIDLLLLKLYLSNTCIEISDILNFFELPPETILLTGAKLLLNTDTEKEISHILNLTDLSSINLNEETQYNFITETLIPFDQILRATTTNLWYSYKEKTKHISALNNLQSKLASQDTYKASAATAAAIAKASEQYDKSQNTNLHTNLRLSNLEKAVRKHDQRANELQKTLKKPNIKHTQKNYKGRHLTESMTSPTLFRKTLSKQQLKTNREQDILDLTNEDSQSTDTSVDSLEAIPTSFPHNTQKRKRLTDFPSPQKRRGKSIQWRPAETQQFQPHYPSNFLLNVAQTHGPHSQNYNTQTNTPNAFYQLTHQPLFPTSTLLQPLTPSNTWYNPSSQITTSRSNPFQHPIQNNPNNPFITTGLQRPPQKQRKNKRIDRHEG
jgi:hypothetical protein